MEDTDRGERECVGVLVCCCMRGYGGCCVCVYLAWQMLLLTLIYPFHTILTPSFPMHSYPIYLLFLKTPFEKGAWGRWWN